MSCVANECALREGMQLILNGRYIKMQPKTDIHYSNAVHIHGVCAVVCCSVGGFPIIVLVRCITSGAVTCSPLV